MSTQVVPAGLEHFLKSFELAIMTNENWLSSSDAEHLSAETRRILGRFNKPSVAEPAKNLFGQKERVDEYDVVLAEIEQTISELKTLESTISDAETGDRIQFVKAKTSLLERWSAQKEKLINTKSTVQFMQTIIDALEEVLIDHKDLRTEFIKRIRTLKSSRELNV